MEPGSVLVYTGSVFHGGGANTTAAERIGLNITYALGWLRQEENQYLSCPPEIARTLEPELQELLGYATGQYALGYYTPPLPPGAGPEMVPPEHALRGGDGGSVFGSDTSRDAVRAAIAAATSD
jgi:ectoine hydroxylase-related dioxygenase (phytanoyl-CoA dioxygenase family)